MFGAGYRWVLAAPVAVAAALSFAAGFLPEVAFVYRNPALHVAIETANGLIALIAFLLALGRLRDRVVVSDLVLAVALGLLAFTNILFSTVPAAAVNGGHPGAFATWAPVFSRLAGGIVLMAAAFAPAAKVGHPSRAIAQVMGATLLLLALIAAAVLVLEPVLAPAFNPRLTPATADDVRLAGPPGVIVAQFAGFVAYAVAGLGFLRRFDRSGDELLGWLAAAAMLLAFSRVEKALFPAVYPDWLYTSDLLRLSSYLLILAGVAREIARAQREGALAAALEERRRVARDIHDGLAHELAFIATHAQRIGTTTVGRRGEQARLVDELGKAARRALEESRFAIAALTEPVDEPLDASVTRAAEEVAIRYGARLRFDVEGPIHVPTATRTAVTRIVREAVSNAVRHSGAHEVHVELTRHEAGLRLAVSDSGRGFNPETPNTDGFGLRSMRERADALGARLELRAAPGAGCRVELELP